MIKKYLEKIFTVPVSDILLSVLLLANLIIILFGSLIAPFSQSEIISQSWQQPSSRHILGTDSLGRDIFSRILHGAKVSFYLAFSSALISITVGILLGFAASYYKAANYIITGLVNILISIPTLLLCLFVLTVKQNSLIALVITAGILEALKTFITMKPIMDNIINSDYIKISLLRKESFFYILIYEILPVVKMPALIELGARFSTVFLLISALNFLGLGVQEPTAEWGAMVRENAIAINFGMPNALFPAFAIAQLSICINFLLEKLSTHNK